MKKTLLLVLAAILLISLSAFAGGSGAKKDEITIAMIVKNIGNPFFDVGSSNVDNCNSLMACCNCGVMVRC